VHNYTKNQLLDMIKTRLCLVEDDYIIREGFAALLSQTSDFEVVGAYSNCEDYLKNLTTDRPDVVLMDLELPRMGGVEGIERTKKHRPQTQLIVVTVYENDGLVFKALCAGAGGYLTKNMPPSRFD